MHVSYNELLEECLDYKYWGDRSSSLEPVVCNEGLEMLQRLLEANLVCEDDKKNFTLYLQNEHTKVVAFDKITTSVLLTFFGIFLGNKSDDKFDMLMLIIFMVVISLGTIIYMFETSYKGKNTKLAFIEQLVAEM
ncbi:MAG: hypothetical protein ATN36_05445 [Epulopiscium sp. Nele67-Bin005]|nr:MAG: hypothetical protein ATN36_05445 [Epulopiscium sp. Nele67-Bin005]